ncbi:MAG: alkaline ceramidase, partial [Pirellulales bacterium]
MPPSRDTCPSDRSPPQASAHAAFRGKIGVARADITPPVGIYARNWGAAEHDVAESIHRPLSLTALSLRSPERPQPLLLVDTDLGWWRTLDTFRVFQRRLLDAFSVDPQSLLFALSHTHSAPTLTQSDTTLPGGHLLADFLDQVFEATVDCLRRAIDRETDGLLDWHAGDCQLASARDLRDPSDAGRRVICGYDPTVPADTTLLVGRVTDPSGKIVATLVNYACHPTTLAWENRAISPDFVGAMRETIETATGGAPALFLQGASGELAPRVQYVGDPRVADRHGRQLGFAALATLEDMHPPATQLVFDRVVESGAPLAVWRHQAVVPSTVLRAIDTHVDLPLKEWPTSDELQRQCDTCRDRSLAERLHRQLHIPRA